MSSSDSAGDGREPARPPGKLASARAWLCWKFVPTEKGKPRKVPYYVSGGPRSGHNTPGDLARLATFDEAAREAVRQGMAGVGLALRPDLGISVFDLDNSISSGDLLPEAREVIEGCAYVERSPSGSGVHAFVLGKWENRKQAHRKPFGIEVFHENGFVTWTGNALPGFDSPMLLEAPRRLAALYEATFCDGPEPKSASNRKEDEPATAETIDDLRSALIWNATHSKEDDEPDGHDGWIKDGQALASLARRQPEWREDARDLWIQRCRAGVRYDGNDRDAERRWRTFDGDHTGYASIFRRAQELGWLNPRSAEGTALSAVANADLFFHSTGDEHAQAFAEHAAQVALAGIMSAGAKQRALERIAEATGINVPPTSADGFEDEPEGSTTPPRAAGATTRSRLRVWRFEELKNRPPTKWLVPGWLTEQGVSVLFGPSNSGKSAVVLDLLMSIAGGYLWHGIQVKQGAALLVALEGANGLRYRMEAWGRHFGLSPADLHALPLGMVDAGVDLFTSPADATAVIEAARMGIADQRVRIIVIDTLGKALNSGNENEATDVRKVMRHAQRISNDVGCLVLLIHHTGKDVTKGARGTAVLKDDSETMIELQREPGGGSLRLEKQREASTELTTAFKLQQVDVGLDDEGKEISSVVAVPIDPMFGDRSVGSVGRQPGPQEMLIMQALDELAALDESTNSDAVILRAMDLHAARTGSGAKARRSNVQRSMDSLVSKGLVTVVDGHVRRAGAP